MRKHRSVTPRRSPRFEALEGRQLLSTGNFVNFSSEDVVVVTSPAHDLSVGPAEIALGIESPQSSWPSNGTLAWGQGAFASHQSIAPEYAPVHGVASDWAYPVGPLSIALAKIPDPPLFSSGDAQDLFAGFTELPSGAASISMNPASYLQPDVETGSMTTDGWGSVAVAGQMSTSGSITDAAMNPGSPGGPMISTSSASPSAAGSNGGFGTSDSFAIQNFMNILERAEVAPPGGASTIFPGPVPAPLAPSFKVRSESNESGPTQSTSVSIYLSTNGVLTSVGPQGPGTTLETNATNPGLARGMDGPQFLVGVNAPVPPSTFLGPDGDSAMPPSTASGYQGHGIGFGPVVIGRGPRLSGLSPNATGSFQWAWSSTNSASNGVPGEPDPELPVLRGADLIAEAIPTARESLESALEDFVNQLGGMDLGLLNAQGPGPIALVSVAVVTSAVSVELARRYMQRRNALNRGVVAIDTSGRPHTLGFPELPGSWSERRA